MLKGFNKGILSTIVSYKYLYYITHYHDMETQRASNSELECFICKCEWTVNQIAELPVIWDAMTPMCRKCYGTIMPR